MDAYSPRDEGGDYQNPHPTKEQHLGAAVEGRVHTLCAVHPPLFLAND